MNHFKKKETIRYWYNYIMDFFSESNLITMRFSFFLGRITVVLLLGLLLRANGQTTAVLTGYVADATTGKPMPFANVYVNGSTRGAVTDEKGAYTLVGIPLGTVEVIASYVGYQPDKRTFRFDNTSPQKADFRLKTSEQTLETVIVRGTVSCVFRCQT